MKHWIFSTLGAAALVVTTTVPAQAQTATTEVLLEETLTDVEMHTLPTPPVHPAKYTLPMDIQVTKDSGISTNTPITDQYGSDISRWAELIRECMKDKPILVRVVGEEAVPFMMGPEGKIKLNANDKPVCPV